MAYRILSRGAGRLQARNERTTKLLRKKKRPARPIQLNRWLRTKQTQFCSSKNLQFAPSNVNSTLVNQPIRQKQCAIIKPNHQTIKPTNNFFKIYENEIKF
jgi:hypothetical protein